jgi:hypothetical protein
VSETARKSHGSFPRIPSGFYAKEIATKRVFHRQYEAASESYLKRFRGKTQRLDEQTKSRKITGEEDTKGMPLRDVWDISIEAGFKAERTQYPTQKPRELIERILAVCSDPGDLVLDCFIGSGTTAAAAQLLGRRWIGCDINKGAIQTTSKRLQDVIDEQIGVGERLDHGEGPPVPAQLSFTTWRVNDYDLRRQHNEAIALACEHLGVERSRTDRFFDGTLGKALVKIVPFTRPLSPADLEEIRTEIEARPDDEREIRVVCLGMELAAQAWLEEWNRYRRGRNAANRIEAIELRTDERYGSFLAHDPAQASVRIERKEDVTEVEIEDFISPSIMARLAGQTGVVQPRIDDWRSMVDSVMIDTTYDGDIFDVTMSDVPERKTDYVRGKYELPAPSSPSAVAVKITDMLGEEVVVVREV